MSEIEVVREWSGTAASVGRALDLAEARGQLVSVEPLRANAQGVVVRVVLRTPTAPRQTPTRSRRAAWAVGACVGVAVGVGVAWLVVAVVAWIAAHVTQILGGLALVCVGLVLLTYALGRVGVCPGFHCPGCRHR